jgi:hypothetical protein
LFEGQAVKTYSGGKPNYTEPIEQEPTSWMKECADFWDHYTYINEAAQEKYEEEAQMWLKKLRTALPKKEWVGLTSEELEFYTEELGQGELGRGVLRAVVDFLKEKNSG